MRDRKLLNDVFFYLVRWLKRIFSTGNAFPLLVSLID